MTLDAQTNYARQAEAARLRYFGDAIETASPISRLLMLYDALESDLRQADEAFEPPADGLHVSSVVALRPSAASAPIDLKLISDRLIHAQEIIVTLRSTLRMDVWDGAPRLAALYDFLHAELLGANLDKDRARLGRVAALVAKLAAAWRQAAGADPAEEMGAQEVASGLA